MKITKVSKLTGVTHTREIDVTQEQIDDWHRGTLIQYAMPNLTVDEREFMKSGATAEEWDNLFGPEE